MEPLKCTLKISVELCLTLTHYYIYVYFRWDIKSTDCIQTFKLPQDVATGDIAVNSLLLVPRHTDQIIACNRSSSIFATTLNGQVIHKFQADTEGDGIFITAIISPQGKYLYALTESGKLHCFLLSTGKLEHVLMTHEKDVRGLSHHPHLNLISTISADGTMILWSP
jgi:WD40 repeat-containing protein SMU1